MTKINSELTFVVRKTMELSNYEIKEINNLFNTTFEKERKNPRSENEFKAKFLNNFLNFSFHGLMKSESKIVGCYHIIPYEFIFFSNKKLFGQSVDTTIHPDFRGNIYNLKKLVKTVYDEIKRYGIFFVYGLPNEKFYLVKKKILGWRDIGKLNYYIFPIKINKFNKKLYYLDILFFLLIKFLIKAKICLNYEYKFSIFKIYNDDFHLSRYSNDYQIFSNKNFKLIYKEVINKKYNNARIIYIIDVVPLTKRNLEDSVNQLTKSNKNADLILYIGKLKKTPCNLFKIPHFLLKRQINVSGKILDSSQMKEKVFNISNWNINLSNFDIK